MKHLVFLVFLLLFVKTAEANEITDFEPVRIRSDGYVIDKNGRITGAMNRDDPRNTEYVYYYLTIDEYGLPSKESEFMIMANPINGKGFVRVNIDKTKPVDIGDYQAVEQGFVTEYTKTTNE